MRLLALLVCTLALALGCSKSDAPPAAQARDNPRRMFQLARLEKVELEAGGHRFKAWLMDTPLKQEEGMMHLTDEEVGADDAMLFAFDEPRSMTFWMKDTLIPLDIAFISPDGKVLNVEVGHPLDESAVPSKGVAQFVVETKAGAAARLGLTSGAVVKLPPPLTKPVPNTKANPPAKG
ncbi:MAG: DUF192 domain-containing protein [Fimbriimonas ginsengisoli]|uniref:DUF192 domain-containing protein n=1 Tax=Fimbriimonas ginsengisoli TaxID=1005039 RepID=A0A931LQM1_FIMGI|nr:DUF192 domain-containing protein [Fimbriimonas ginsengisoli]MBI3721323.1 DUF192 domain-containing protein [Fimbriimonas ginsengisoli]